MAQVRLAALAALLLIGACSAEVSEPAGHSVCLMAHQAFDESVTAAISARRNGEMTEAIYQTNIAQMNLDIILQRDCCRFAETCPAFALS